MDQETFELTREYCPFYRYAKYQLDTGSPHMGRSIL